MERYLKWYLDLIILNMYFGYKVWKVDLLSLENEFIFLKDGAPEKSGKRVELSR